MVFGKVYSAIIQSYEPVVKFYKTRKSVHGTRMPPPIEPKND